eukprot:910271_1
MVSSSNCHLSSIRELIYFISHPNFTTLLVVSGEKSLSSLTNGRNYCFLMNGRNSLMIEKSCSLMIEKSYFEEYGSNKRREELELLDEREELVDDREELLLDDREEPLFDDREEPLFDDREELLFDDREEPLFDDREELLLDDREEPLLD